MRQDRRTIQIAEIEPIFVSWVRMQDKGQKAGQQTMIENRYIMQENRCMTRNRTECRASDAD